MIHISVIINARLSIRRTLHLRHSSQSPAPLLFEELYGQISTKAGPPGCLDQSDHFGSPLSAAILELAMNTIREIQKLNKRELEANVSIAGSWHRDFDDTAYIYIGGLPFDLSEGDIITIFSQYGEPTYVNLIRDKESGKSKGFAFLKYEDQRSTDLAVDNLGGASIMGRVLKVDHTRYKRKDGEEEDEREREMNGTGGIVADEDDEREEAERRPLLKEEVELMKLERDHDEDDPMKDFLLQEKREEVAQVLARLKGGERERGKKHKHHHRHEDKRRDHRFEEGDDRRHRQRHSHRRRSRSR